ncbi:hypothetical protein [Acinetobacter rudis]|uniref:Uncharacterized protein n=1 Tax=Acinetobacter rudis CIP 110305 TaxID=421052 RepID=S3P4Q2_9GAMM|nr:hypothetical protein [Acinetobacter rudis]EPF73796.1 hypothetical protein F945_01955 [Acinetobacter rudis CIP 110305]
MGGKPKIVQQDPEADARKAAEEAAIKTNAKTAQRNKNRSQSMLAGADAPQQKTTLGGG